MCNDKMIRTMASPPWCHLLQMLGYLFNLEPCDKFFHRNNFLKLAIEETGIHVAQRPKLNWRGTAGFSSEHRANQTDQNRKSQAAPRVTSNLFVRTSRFKLHQPTTYKPV